MRDAPANDGSRVELTVRFHQLPAVLPNYVSQRDESFTYLTTPSPLGERNQGTVTSKWYTAVTSGAGGSDGRHLDITVTKLANLTKISVVDAISKLFSFALTARSALTRWPAGPLLALGGGSSCYDFTLFLENV